MRMVTRSATRFFICSAVLFASAFLSSCCRRYVERVGSESSVAYERGVSVRCDSVLFRDSVFVSERSSGDTVYVERVRARVRDVVRVRFDTLVRSDTFVRTDTLVRYVRDGSSNSGVLPLALALSASAAVAVLLFCFKNKKR